MITRAMYRKYLAYLKTKQWYAIKANVIKIRGPACEKCGAKSPPAKLQLHHLTYANLYNELLEDLQLLCSTCHKKEHSKKKKNGRKRR